MPEAGNSCGFHAWKTEAKARDFAQHNLPASSGYIVIIGEVELWGQVIEHAEGYRAEYAKIKSLTSCIFGGGVVGHYGCHLDDARRAYGFAPAAPPQDPAYEAIDIAVKMALMLAVPLGALAVVAKVLR